MAKAQKSNIFKKIIFTAISLILVAIIAFVGMFFFYYPSYKRATPLEIETLTNENEVIVMSSNLRCITPQDMGKKSWFYRAELILQNIQNECPDIIGFQEATKYHYQYLCENLPQYSSVIEYRDKSTLAESCPVFYRTDKFNLVDKGSFWLSETPEVMSKSWGAACYRVCSYVILETKESEKQFVVFNTHLDHISDEARINGIQVILDKIKAFDDLPSFIMGDLNCTEDSETYKNATETFFDAKYLTENTMTSCTYQNYGAELDRDCIDYFMISKNGFEVELYKVITTTYNGIYPSDHFPILTKLILD